MMVMIMNHIKPDLENNHVNHDIVNVTERVKYNVLYPTLLIHLNFLFPTKHHTSY